MQAVEDRIEKVVEIAAPVAKVWKAVTDHEQFGSWFKVALDGPFVLCGVSRGHMTYPGYEHLPWLAVVERMEPERLFAFRWQVYDEESAGAIADEPTTLAEFRLEPAAAGTGVTIRELGFAALPEKRGRRRSAATPRAGTSRRATSPNMPLPETAPEPCVAAPVFAALGDPTRLGLVLRLRTGGHGRSPSSPTVPG